MPDAVEQAPGGDHDLGVAVAHAVVGDLTLGTTPRRNRIRASRSPMFSTICTWTQLVVAHPSRREALTRRDVPQRLHVLARVDRVEQQLEPAVAAGRRADADVRQRLARRDRRIGLAHSDPPAGARPRAGRRGPPERGPERSAAAWRISSPAGSSRTRSMSSSNRRATSTRRARTRAAPAPARTRRASSSGPGDACAARSRCRRPRQHSAAGGGSTSPSTRATRSPARRDLLGRGRIGAQALVGQFARPDRRTRRTSRPESGTVPTTSSDDPPPTSTTAERPRGDVAERTGGPAEGQPGLLLGRQDRRPRARTIRADRVDRAPRGWRPA